MVRHTPASAARTAATHSSPDPPGPAILPRRTAAAPDGQRRDPPARLRIGRPAAVAPQGLRRVELPPGVPALQPPRQGPGPAPPVRRAGRPGPVAIPPHPTPPARPFRKSARACAARTGPARTGEVGSRPSRPFAPALDHRLLRRPGCGSKGGGGGSLHGNGGGYMLQGVEGPGRGKERPIPEGTDGLSIRRQGRGTRKGRPSQGGRRV